MLDSETKRRIDNTRDILVGKVPDPKSQVEQITFALIYKFMDDMDQLSVSIGGNPSFFSNGYEQFAWSKLMDKRLGGEARLDLYVRALDQMSQNPYIPQLFRDVFKGAFLPYRDSETLNLFLKEINGFTYTHSEDLGDAYEYLLSVFGSQGKAGQFRTPRHIIDFIVACVNPGKDDSVLDPACGTAGFLVSAYKHILQAHTQNPLSPDEKKRLTGNFVGYDISPDMVRLSRVNMYLHQFPNPTIHEYDTLTTEDRWDDTFDVILANPPFMSPSGGIRPHKRFAVRANRSEVLFVDYIAEHLNVGGRAGVIVPEGIIFQSSNAYKALRKMLVEENYLVAVISLPAGVFNPYSGVKTSVLLLDKALARRSDSVLFVKVAADGYGLGAQRREIEPNDLPEALRLVKAFQADPAAALPEGGLAQKVSKSRLAEGGDYNLSAERYRANGVVRSKWPMVRLGEICHIERGTSITKDQTTVGKIPVIAGGQKPAYYHNIANREGCVITVSSSGAYAGFVNYYKEPIFASDCTTVRPKEESKAITYFVYLILKHNQGIINNLRSGMAQPHVYAKDLSKLSIPLPPLEVQRDIVEEIEGYQKVIDGARQVVENYKPVIPIDPSWPMVKLGELCEIKGGKRIPKGMTFSNRITDHPYIRVTDFQNHGIERKGLKFIDDTVFKHISRYTISKNDVYLSIAGTIGLVGIIPKDLEGSNLTENAAKLVIKYPTHLNNRYLVFCIASDYVQKQINVLTHAVGVPKLALERIKLLEIPLAPIEFQNKLVTEMNQEDDLVQKCHEIISQFEEKITVLIERIWETS